ncbi:hypothetical protein A6R68_16671, partial [Neotoma lepida]
LKSLQIKNTQSLSKYSEVTKETVFCYGLHSQLLMEQTQLKNKVDMMKQENKKQMEDWFLLKHQLQSLEERVQFLMKQKEMVTQEKDLAEMLQPHFEVSQMR